MRAHVYYNARAQQVEKVSLSILLLLIIQIGKARFFFLIHLTTYLQSERVRSVCVGTM